MPSPPAVFARCMALLGSPLNANRGPYLLTFLMHYSVVLQPILAKIWTHKIPQLINYLEGKYNKIICSIPDSFVFIGFPKHTDNLHFWFGITTFCMDLVIVRFIYNVNSIKKTLLQHLVVTIITPLLLINNHYSWRYS